MKVYTVHEKLEPTSDRIERGEQLQFVTDGFSATAALFPPLALVTHGLWLGLAVYLATGAVMTTLLQAAGASSSALTIAWLALDIWVGFEFNEWRRTALENKGWSTLALVSGPTTTECERRFLDGWLPRQPMLTLSNRDSDRSPERPTSSFERHPLSTAQQTWSRLAGLGRKLRRS